MKPILHIPHASDILPDRAGYLVTEEKLQEEIMLLTDWHTNGLFYYSRAIPVIAEYSRVFCDVERFADDKQEIMAKAGMGVIYTKCDDGSDLRILSPESKQLILNNYYQPHHQKLNDVVTEQINAVGRALIIDCHSFSNEPFRRDLNQHTPRPAICIGTDEFHTPSGLLDFTYTYFKLAGYKVQVNSPYSGSIVPLNFYRIDDRVHSIMIEVNRNIYMVPGTNKKSRGYLKAQRIINTYLRKVSELMCCDYPDLCNDDITLPPPPEREF